MSSAVDPLSNTKQSPRPLAEVPWPERLAELGRISRHALRALGMLRTVNAPALTAMVLTALIDAAAVVAMAWVGKRLIDVVVLSASMPPPKPLAASAFWVALELVLVAFRAGCSQLGGLASTAARNDLGLHVNLQILEKAESVSYSRFEDPEFMNALSLARREASSRPLELVEQALTTVKSVVTLSGFVALLVSLGSWSLLVLVAAAIPPFLAEARYGRALHALRTARTLRNRKTFYLESVLTTEQTVKEVKLFHLARWLRERYREIHRGFRQEEVQLASARARTLFALGLVGSVALYATYLWIVAQTVLGHHTLGSMTLYVLVLRQGQGTLQSALSTIARSYETNLYMDNLFRFLSLPSDEPLGSDQFPPPGTAPRIEFRGVSFRYQGATRNALSSIDLVIDPGQTLALVGRNGAGKTTLVKLLVGLHRPTEGSILIDGVSVADMDVATLRAKIGVIFQDFARFQFSARENVGIGWLPSVNDDETIHRALGEAGADEVLARLPQGLETPLGRAFGGDDLSVGQWQRIALARAFMRESRILILDEPTASLDAESEHELFQRFRDLKKDRTALLITHRFSTVRMADRIVVFEGGSIVEEGSHEALMELGGRYAGMFRKQAEGYRGGPGDGA